MEYTGAWPNSAACQEARSFQDRQKYQEVRPWEELQQQQEVGLYREMRLCQDAQWPVLCPEAQELHPCQVGMEECLLWASEPFFEPQLLP